MGGPSTGNLSAVPFPPQAHLHGAPIVHAVVPEQTLVVVVVVVHGLQGEVVVVVEGLGGRRVHRPLRVDEVVEGTAHAVREEDAARAAQQHRGAEQ